MATENRLSTKKPAARENVGTFSAEYTFYHRSSNAEYIRWRSASPLSRAKSSGTGMDCIGWLAPSGTVATPVAPHRCEPLSNGNIAAAPDRGCGVACRAGEGVFTGACSFARAILGRYRQPHNVSG